MIQILLGFVGAMTVIALLFIGGVIGWFLHKAFVKHTSPVAEPPEEKERRRLIEEQDAFKTLQNYNAERAYGMVRDDGDALRQLGGDR
jgi:hypothetical protein